MEFTLALEFTFSSQLTNLDFHLQTGNLGYKTGLSFTNGDSWVTNGILGLLFT